MIKVLEVVDRLRLGFIDPKVKMDLLERKCNISPKFNMDHIVIRWFRNVVRCSKRFRSVFDHDWMFDWF